MNNTRIGIPNPNRDLDRIIDGRNFAPGRPDVATSNFQQTPQPQDRLGTIEATLQALALDIYTLQELVRRSLNVPEDQFELTLLQIRRDLTQPKPDPRYITQEQLTETLTKVLQGLGHTLAGTIGGIPPVPGTTGAPEAAPPVDGDDDDDPEAE